jgi:hypothetical protein
MAMSSSNETTQRVEPTGVERRTRTLILVGTTFLLVGIALAVTDDDWGRWVTVAGVLVLFVTLHRFGRLGAD